MIIINQDFVALRAVNTKWCLNQRTYGLTQRLPFFLLLLLTFEELIAKGHLCFTTMLPWSCTDFFKITSHTRKKSPRYYLEHYDMCNDHTYMLQNVLEICLKTVPAGHNCFWNVYFLDPFSKLTYSSGYQNLMQIKTN